jgi:hypothetical protein
MYVYDSVVTRGDGDSLGASHVIWAAPLLALPAAGKYALFVVIKNLISYFQISYFPNNKEWPKRKITFS